MRLRPGNGILERSPQSPCGSMLPKCQVIPKWLCPHTLEPKRCWWSSSCDFADKETEAASGRAESVTSFVGPSDSRALNHVQARLSVNSFCDCVGCLSGCQPGFQQLRTPLQKFIWLTFTKSCNWVYLLTAVQDVGHKPKNFLVPTAVILFPHFLIDWEKRNLTRKENGRLGVWLRGKNL